MKKGQEQVSDFLPEKIRDARTKRIADICRAQMAYDQQAKGPRTFFKTVNRTNAYDQQVESARELLSGLAESGNDLTEVETEARDVAAMICLFYSLEQGSQREDLVPLLAAAGVDEDRVVGRFKKGMYTLAVHATQAQCIDAIDSMQRFEDLEAVTFSRDPARETIVHYYIRELVNLAAKAEILPAAQVSTGGNGWH